MRLNNKQIEIIESTLNKILANNQVSLNLGWNVRFDKEKEEVFFMNYTRNNDFFFNVLRTLREVLYGVMVNYSSSSDELGREIFIIYFNVKDKK